MVCVVSVMGSGGESGMRDQRVWSVVECAETFRHSVTQLRQQLSHTAVANDSTVPGNDSHDGTGAPPAVLVWDKVSSHY